MFDPSVTLGAAEASEAGRFWADVLLSGPMLWSAAIALACLIALGGGLMTLNRLHRRRAVGSPTLDADGTATIEFALVTPILLFFGLVLTQTTMLMAGHIFVNYSAYAAARSAIVQIPSDYADDAANWYTGGTGNTKHARIRRAAIFAVAPVGGELESGGGSVDADEFVESLRTYYRMNGDTEPRWLDTLTADRLRYAAENTTVTVMTPVVDHDNHTIEYEPISPGGRHYFEARDPVTTQVVHRLNLGVPYVNRIFADGAHDDAGGRYITLTADYTLTLEGIRDELPPDPTPATPRSP